MKTAKTDAPEKRFKIMHTMVGPFKQGRVISEAQLKAVATSGYDHLLTSGAIVLEKEEPVDNLPTPVSPENRVNEPLHNLETGKTGKTAKAATEPDKTADDDDDEVTETREDLLALGKPELVKRAKGLGIDTAGLKKDDLADAILAKQTDADASGADDDEDDDDDDDEGAEGGGDDDND